MAQATNTTEQANLYNQIVRICNRQKHDSAFYFAEQALALAQTQSNTQAILTAHLQLADALRQKSDDVGANSHITTVEDQLKQRNFPMVKVHLFLIKGLLAYSQYKDEEALRLFEEGYALNQQYQAGFCIDFCINLSHLSAPTEAENYIKRGFNCPVDIRDKILLQAQLGNLYKEQKRYKEALELFTNNKQIAQNIKDTLAESNAYQNIGGVYLLEGDWKKAIDFYLKSTNLKKKIGDQKGVAHVQHNLAMVYFEQGKYETSLEYYQKCEQYYSNNKDTAELVEIWSNTASVYIAQQQYEQANNLLNQVVPLLEQFPNPTVALKSQMDLGDIQLKKENYQAALKLFQNSMEAAKQQEDYFTLVTVYNFLGSTYYLLQDNKQSIVYYQEALSLSTKLNLRYEQHLALFGLYKSHKAQGNTTQALDWHEQYTSIKDSLYNVETTTMLEQYDNLQKQKEIETLKAKNEKIALEKELQAKQFYLVLLVGVLLLGGLGALWWRRQKAFLHQQEIRDLVKTKGEELLEAIVKVEQKERKRLAQEIHDTLGTYLALLRMQHCSNENLVDDPTYRERHLTMSDLITQTASEMRRISHQMNTGGQFSFDLQEAIETLVMFAQKFQKIEVVFNYMGEELELSRMMELALCRTVQESLCNILIHAQATEVTIQIHQSADEVTLMIEDNGRGFDTTMVPNGIGLKNIRQRVEALGGILEIDSSPQTGTCIHVQLPIS
jgi:signal transduction histidine kinase